MIEPRPCAAAEAVSRAQLIAYNGGQYLLGTGDYRPRQIPNGIADLPWTERDGEIGCDCAGLIVWCYRVPRHRPGYNRGGKYDVEDDINCNSMLGDAMGARDLFTLVTDRPQIGDVIAYPSFYLHHDDGTLYTAPDGKALHWIGHTGIVVGVDRVPEEWDITNPDWHYLDMAQCCGPERREPAVILTDGVTWTRHDAAWPKIEHRSWLLRLAPAS